jgi:ADP-ribose pyrophosphatase
MTTAPLSRRILFSWRHFSGVLRDVLLPNGKPVTTFTLEHPGAVVIIPITDSGSILFLSQYRPALNETIFELPAGTLEQGEDPAACAARELIEETGFAAKNLIPLGKLLPAPGFCNEVQWCFAATGLSPASAAGDDDEVIEVREMSVNEAKRLIETGELIDAKSIALLMKGLIGGLVRGE